MLTGTEANPASPPAPVSTDPLVTADPPRVAEPVAAPSAAAAPKPEAARREKVTMPNKEKKGGGEDAVLSRARRMFRSEMKKVAQALGMETYEPDAFNKTIGDLVKARESGKSSGEQQASRIKELEEANVELRAKMQLIGNENSKLKREVQSAHGEVESQRAEFELRSLASSAGVKDLDYGLHLLRQHLSGIPEGQEVDETVISSFFEGLKKAKPILFNEERVAAGPRTLAEEQKPNAGQGQPAGNQGPGQVPSQGAPAPGAPTRTGGSDVNALDMKRTEFSNYAKQQYGYTPGMA